MTDRYGTPPILVLDDVLSELDGKRRSALLRAVPAGQTLLTTAADLPTEISPSAVLEVTAPGTVEWR